MDTPQKTALKTLLIDSCMAKLQDTVINLKRETDDCQQMANEYGPPKDRYDAFRMQLLRKRDMFAQQMAKANQELSVLSIIKPDAIKMSVAPGSIILTPDMNYFIAVSMGQIEAGGMKFMCMSPAVPLYKVLQGLKAGDKTTFNNKTIIISDVF